MGSTCLVQRHVPESKLLLAGSFPSPVESRDHAREGGGGSRRAASGAQEAVVHHCVTAGEGGHVGVGAHRDVVLARRGKVLVVLVVRNVRVHGSLLVLRHGKVPGERRSTTRPVLGLRRVRLRPLVAADARYVGRRRRERGHGVGTGDLVQRRTERGSLVEGLEREVHASVARRGQDGDATQAQLQELDVSGLDDVVVAEHAHLALRVLDVLEARRVRSGPRLRHTVAEDDAAAVGEGAQRERHHTRDLRLRHEPVQEGSLGVAKAGSLLGGVALVRVRHHRDGARRHARDDVGVERSLPEVVAARARVGEPCPLQPVERVVDAERLPVLLDVRRQHAVRARPPHQLRLTGADGRRRHAVRRPHLGCPVGRAAGAHVRARVAQGVVCGGAGLRLRAQHNLAHEGSEACGHLGLRLGVLEDDAVARRNEADLRGVRRTRAQVCEKRVGARTVDGQQVRHLRGAQEVAVRRRARVAHADKLRVQRLLGGAVPQPDVDGALGGQGQGGNGEQHTHGDEGRTRNEVQIL
eukprot:Rhum_TRINITY_DN19086_c0_g1::Rhum_TRINITY_DN19086_c0_g1_i1::g.169229::m.169229